MTYQIFSFFLVTSATIGTASILDGVNPNNFGTLDELVKYIISIVGALLAPIIIDLFKKNSSFKIKKINSVLCLRFKSILSPHQVRTKLA